MRTTASKVGDLCIDQRKARPDVVQAASDSIMMPILNVRCVYCQLD
jgi:hypothetical protein